MCVCCLPQNTEDDECPVVTEYLRLMSLDSVAAVREAAVTSVCISETTLPEIIKRGRDVSATVRKMARSKMLRAVQETARNSDGASVSDADVTMSSTSGSTVQEA